VGGEAALRGGVAVTAKPSGGHRCHSHAAEHRRRNTRQPGSSCHVHKITPAVLPGDILAGIMTKTILPPGWVDEYLARIGIARPDSADLQALGDLQQAHQLTVPFENLSIHLGEPIVLDQAELVTKVVRRRRGGFCYELNGAFSALLTALGFRVSLLSARVLGEDRPPGPPFDHMTLRVDLTEPWLVDVGFGRFAMRPLRLGFAGDQPDPAGTFRIVAGPDDVDVFHDGQPAYRVDPRPYALSDFAPTCWWQQTSPGSHFRQSLTCSIPSGSGRVTLSGDRLIVTRDGQREESTLTSDAEILAAYRRYFGITLDTVPVAVGSS
jgi:N-hydroxyarylamine O-acetyltransferase